MERSHDAELVGENLAPPLPGPQGRRAIEPAPPRLWRKSIEDLQRWVAESLDTGREIDALVSAVPAMLDGEYGPLALSALQQRVPRPLNLMNLAMDCASYASEDRLDRIRGEGPGSLLGLAMDFPLPGLCEVEGLPRLPDEFREPVKSAVPTLLIAGTLDGRTPVRNAREVAADLTNATVLVIDDASHDLFGYREAMDEVLAFFSADIRP